MGLGRGFIWSKLRKPQNEINDFFHLAYNVSTYPTVCMWSKPRQPGRSEADRQNGADMIVIGDGSRVA